MARPKKQGLDYFPMDVDADTDDRVEYVVAKCGFQAFGVYVKILMSIYKNGYALEFGEVQRTVFARRVYMDVDEVDRILQECLRVGLLDKTIYEEKGILTSASIQRRYLAATEKRTDSAIDESICLVSDEKLKKTVSEEKTISKKEFSPKKLPENSPKTDVNSELMPQSKVKESKVNKSKANIKDNPQTPKGDSVPYSEIVEHFNLLCPSLSKAEKMSEARKRGIRARWGDLKTIDAVDSFFAKVEASDFLTGRKTDFKASFDWVFKESNFIKIQEGNYDNRRNDNGLHGDDDAEGESVYARAFGGF